jgi:hypothetical protein
MIAAELWLRKRKRQGSPSALPVPARGREPARLGTTPDI